MTAQPSPHDKHSMTRDMRNLSERQILKAIAEGKLKNLEGEGKPLPDRPEESVTDAATLAGVRIMAEAGAMPEEFQIKKRVAEIRERLAKETDPARRKPIMAELADAMLRLDIAHEARRKFLK